MRILTLCLSLFITMLTCSFTFAQVKTITGTVTGQDDKLPLPGVAVAVKGTSLKVQTDKYGKYEIKVPGKHPKLVFTYTGYKSQKLKVDSTNVINVDLEIDPKYVVDLRYTGMPRPNYSNDFRTIKGTIISKEDRVSLPGVLVQVKGTSIRVWANSSGKYEIKVPDGSSTLLFTFIGYKTEEHVLGKKSILNIILEETGNGGCG